MKALVTGGAGFIGSHLCERLVKLGVDVLCFDNLSSGKLDHISHLRGHRNFEFMKGDLINQNDVKNAVNDVDVVFHLAAKVGVRRYVEDPIDVIRTNVLGTYNLIEAARVTGIERFAFASSSEVYGKNVKAGLTEDSDRILGPPTIDRWCYSSSKAIDEHLCNAYFRKYRFPMVILRYFNIYGPRQDSSDYGGVVSIFTRRVLQDREPLVCGNGNQTRSFTYVDDAVDATVQAAAEDEAIGKTLNIGTHVEITINQLAELVIKLAGKSEKLMLRHVDYEEFYGTWYEDVPRRVPNITMAEKILGFKPQVRLEDGLRKTIEWYKRYLEA